MNQTRLFSFVRLAGVSLATTVALLVLSAGGSPAQDAAEPTKQREKPDSSKQLQDLQKQLEQLTKELDSLRTQPQKSAASDSKKEEQPQPAETKQEPPAKEEPAKTDSSTAKPRKTYEDLKRELAAKSEGAKSATSFQPDWLNSLTWRSVGPAAMGGRIVDIAVVDSDACCFYVATASGGLFKTTNNGISFTPVFDRESTVSIGDVCVAPSNPEIVWVGTGENNARNSVSWGDGVYKSTDGGKSWTNMGLKDSFQIGRIVIHPRNPDIVWVGALGRLWGENDERGVFKTTDGGKTWDKVLFVDAKTGCVDLALCPDDPETILATMYERQRGIYDDGDPIKKWAPGSGLYRSVDGGKTWRKLTEGLPTVLMGRIGVAFYNKNPKTVFAVIETEKVGTGPRDAQADAVPAFMGIQGEASDGAAKLTSVTRDGPADKAGLQPGDIVIAMDGKPVASYSDLTAQISAHKSDDTAKIKFRRDDATSEVELTFGARPTGQGGTAAPPAIFSGGLGGQRENMQDRQGPDGLQTGGIFKSTDCGDTWTRVNSLNPRPFYFSQIRVDPIDENNIFVLGVSLYRSSDGGKTFDANAGRRVHADHHAMWIDPRDGRHIILGGDGGLYVTHDRSATWEHVNIMPLGQFYHVAVDTRRPYRMYGGLQDNGSWGGPSATHGRGGPTNEDWITVGGGDGFTCQADPNDPEQIYYTSQYGRMGRVNIRTGERRTIQPFTSLGRPASDGQPAQPATPRYRYNWKTPFLLSAHNSKIFYAAGNYVFKSLDRGDKLRTISPEIAATNKGTASALAESPLNADVLYVGSDDGALWVSRNGGHDWANITENVKDVPARGFVASIACSRAVEGRAYVTIDAHRVDSTAPFLFVTEDHGKTWSSLRANLADGSARTLREDLKNPNLLYLGTEFGAWISIDRGQYWHKLNNNLPTVAVHEFAQPTTANELVAATHGRSLWIFDITTLRQLTDDVQKAPAHLFKPATAVTWSSSLGRSVYGHKRYVGENPPDGAAIFYMLASEAKEVSLKVIDGEGKTVRDLRAVREPGLHKVVWDLRRGGGTGGGASGGQRTQGSGRGGGAQSQSAAASRSPDEALAAADPTTQAVQQLFGAARTPPGNYRVVLAVDGKELTQTLSVEADPQLQGAIIADDEDDGRLERDREDDFDQ